MRRAGKIDANQPLIVKALRDAGATVRIVSDVGHGFVDIVVGHRGLNFLMEIKDPARKPSERRLTEDERAFHLGWNGQVCVVETVEDALNWLEHGKAIMSQW